MWFFWNVNNFFLLLIMVLYILVDIKLFFFRFVGEVSIGCINIFLSSRLREGFNVLVF